MKSRFPLAVMILLIAAILAGIVLLSIKFWPVVVGIFWTGFWITVPGGVTLYGMVWLVEHYPTFNDGWVFGIAAFASLIVSVPLSPVFGLPAGVVTYFIVDRAGNVQGRIKISHAMTGLAVVAVTTTVLVMGINSIVTGCQLRRLEKAFYRQANYSYYEIDGPYLDYYGSLDEIVAKRNEVLRRHGYRVNGSSTDFGTRVDRRLLMVVALSASPWCCLLFEPNPISQRGQPLRGRFFIPYNFSK